MKNTGFFDENEFPIYVGDILYCTDGYDVLVCEDDDNHFYGSLICEIGHSCRDIPYSLNKGQGHVIIAYHNNAKETIIHG